MSDMPPGVHYVSRDGTRTHLDAALANGNPIMPRPERDVAVALLSFCLEGLEYIDVRERTGITIQPVPAPAT